MKFLKALVAKFLGVDMVPAEMLRVSCQSKKNEEEEKNKDE